MKVLGGKTNTCPICGGTTVYLNVKGIGVVSQCRECNNLVEGRAKDEVIIYSYPGGEVNEKQRDICSC